MWELNIYVTFYASKGYFENILISYFSCSEKEERDFRENSRQKWKKTERLGAIKAWFRLPLGTSWWTIYQAREARCELRVQPHSSEDTLLL